jgi:hypothetical protein
LKPVGRCFIFKALPLNVSDLMVNNESRTDIDIFLPLHHISFHKIIVDSEYYTFLEPIDKFYTVRIITHSDNFDNILLDPKWVIKNTGLTIDINTFVTLDTFIVRKNDLKKSKQLGRIHLTEIKKYRQQKL